MSSRAAPSEPTAGRERLACDGMCSDPRPAPYRQLAMPSDLCAGQCRTHEPRLGIKVDRYRDWMTLPGRVKEVSVVRQELGERTVEMGTERLGIAIDLEEDHLLLLVDGNRRDVTGHSVF